MSLWPRSRADDASPARAGRSAVYFSDNLYAAAAVGIAFVAICALSRWAILGEPGTRLPLVTFYPAVALAALAGGFWPGLIATLGSALLASHFRLMPVAAVAVAEPTDLLALAIFVAGGLIVSSIAEVLKRARRATGRAQVRQRVELEILVLQRTAELARATEALQAEIAERRGFEERMRLTFDSLRDHAVAMLDPEGRVVSWNAGAERQTGYAEPEIVGRSFSQFHLPEDVAAGKPERALSEAAAQGRFEDEGWRLRRDGSQYLANVTINAIRGSTGELRGFVTVDSDITERKRIETELRESNDRFVVAAEAAGLGFWQYDIAARTVRWDEQMFKIRGSTSVDGNHYGIRYSFVHPDDRARVDRELEEATEGRKKFNCEYRIVLQDGGVRHMKSAANLQGDLAAGKASLLGVSFDITERQEIEDQLIQTNLRFALAAEAAELGFWEFDIATRLLHWDDQTFRLYDVDRQDGAQPYELWAGSVHPDDRAKVEEEVRQTAANARKFDAEFRIVWRNGSIKFLRAFAKLTLDPKTGAARMFGVNFDITERKRIENELLEANERFVLAAEAAGLGFWDYEIETQISRWDGQMYKLYGTPRGAALDVAARNDRLHPDDRARVEEALRDAEKGLRDFESEHRIVLPDGRVRHFRTAASLKRDAVGRPARLLGVSFDITERKRIENEVLEANERFVLAAEAAGLGFWDYDIETRVSRWDDQMYRLYGAARGAALDIASRMDRLHPDDRTRVAEALRDAETGLRSFESEHRVVLPDGRVRHFRSAASLKRDAVGRAARLLGVSFDITERNETLEALEQARDAAEAANRAKSEFLAVMSHEIRTPMNGIMGMNALLHETKLTKRQKRMTETIRDSAESLLTIIDDILDLSKLESGKIELEEVDFDLLHLIDRTVDLFAPRAEQKGLSLTTDRTAVSRAALRGDDARLRQILLNLVANAIKFTASGSVTIIAATTDVEASKTRVRCEVRDTGAGVGEGAKKRIFKPFEQADSSISRRFGGTGLGLSICKRLIGLMGGEIGVSDREGGGSVFWFELVLSHAALDIAAQAAKIGETVARAKPTRTGRILLAEDNAINIDVATMILESAGYVVDVAVDGNEAIAAVRKRRYGLVLMDVQMPILDGLTATREIRATERAGDHLPIIAMTANAMKEDQRRCLDAGMDDYFSKPFQPARLIEKVAHWMEQFGAREAANEAAPAAAIDAVPVLDALAVEQLQACFPRNRFDVLLGRFLDELEKHKETLPRLAQTPSLRELGQAAHKLIGSAGHFGARQVQQLATDLEAACGAGDEKSVATLLARFAPASDAASAALQEKYPADDAALSMGGGVGRVTSPFG